jgi:hypothetical protein
LLPMTARYCNVLVDDVTAPVWTIIDMHSQHASICAELYRRRPSYDVVMRFTPFLGRRHYRIYPYIHIRRASSSNNILYTSPNRRISLSLQICRYSRLHPYCGMMSRSIAYHPSWIVTVSHGSYRTQDDDTLSGLGPMNVRVLCLGFIIACHLPYGSVSVVGCHASDNAV